MRPSFAFAALCLIALAACGGESRPSDFTTPTAPTPLPPAPRPVPSNPNRWSIQGRLVETVSGLPVPFATLDLQGFGPFQADAAGAFQLENTTLPPFNPYRITVTKAGYVTRDARVRWERGDRNDVVIDIVRDAAPFSLTFYRQLVRNALEEPGNLRWLARWTDTPKFYMRTVDVNGRAVEPEVLVVVREWLQRGLEMWTNGRWRATILEEGSADRPDTVGWIVIEFHRNQEFYCGRAFVGRNPGRITLNNDRCNCGSIKVPPSTIVHELGHALGFWHVADRQAVMYRQDPGGCYPAVLTATERHHAAIAYSRPIGSRDIDTDPETPGFARSGAVVID